MTETLGSLLAEAAAALTQAGSVSRRWARRLVGLHPRSRRLPICWLIGAHGRRASELTGFGWRWLGWSIANRLSRISAAASSGVWNLACRPDTLDPRPETETVVTAVIAIDPRSAEHRSASSISAPAPAASCWRFSRNSRLRRGLASMSSRAQR